jgi:UDP-N-acetylmuramyl pentapeptide phosphotransferase/UDP-N-acetylglucosamine-1-phosphate transferase
VHALPSLVALLAAALLTAPILRHLQREGHVRENWRGVRVPFPAGIAIVAAGLASLGVCAAIERLADTPVFYGEMLVVLIYALGVALLGLVDDALGGASRGWRGHGAAVARGGFSTGALKAGGSLAVALFALGAYGDSIARYLLAVTLLVLTTNLFNLLDLRPGRAVKGLVLLGAGLVLGTWDARPLASLGLFAVPALVVGLFDLRERAMLGDVGSNLVGALAGLWLVLSLGATGQAIALAIVLALTVYGEFRSLNAAIEGTPLVREIDSLGRNAPDA